MLMNHARDIPLGLPVGSVRAILALTLTGAAIVAAFVPALPSEYLYPAALTVNAFYLAARPRAEAPNADKQS